MIKNSEKYEEGLKKTGEFGIVEQVQYPIISIAGLPGVELHEILEYETGEMGEAFILQNDYVQSLIYSSKPVKVGTKVTRTGRSLSIGVGDVLLGHIIGPLGWKFSKKDDYKKPETMREINSSPPGLSSRSKIKAPFFTGVSVVDMMIPLGRGQKELIIGDRKTGKTSFLFTAIKNQISKGTVVVYAAIGRKKSDIKHIQEFFEHENLKNFVIVATTSHDSPSLIYLTPYTAMTVAEYFRDQGKDVLVVFDDLSTHAKYYREVSLLAKRFPGRDSYPGDIFHAHAKLLERAGNFINPKDPQKDVSITALPIVEIIEGDLTGYIATNLMGITDGHIFFDSNIYYQGMRPAINTSLSVTRVGRQAHSTLARSVTHELTSFLALYEKMQEFSHFGAELTDNVKQILKTGDKLYDFFEQGYKEVLPSEVQITLFSLIWLRLLDEDSLSRLPELKKKMLEIFNSGKDKAMFEDLMKSATLNEFLGKIQQNREKLLTLLKK